MKLSPFEKTIAKSLLYDLKLIETILKNLDKRVLIDFVSKSEDQRKKLIEKMEKDIEFHEVWKY